MRYKSAHYVWRTRTKSYTHSTTCHRARISKPKTSHRPNAAVPLLHSSG